MRHFLLYLSLMISSASFAFESADSALDFVYEYASDTLWGIELTDYRCSYTVGVMEHDVDTIINYRGLYENNELIGSASDTFFVPQDHYAFFITTPYNIIFERQSPYVKYIFLSKQDSSYKVIDTIGIPERLTKWDIVRTDGRTTKTQAIASLTNKIEFYTQKESPIYDVYLIEDTSNFSDIDNVNRLRYLYEDLDKAWNFIIDTHEDTCLHIIYWRDREGNYMMAGMPAPFYTQTDLSTIDGFTKVISKNVDGVRDIKSELNVSVYPNPASDVVHVSIDGCSLSLFANDGKLLKSAVGATMPIKDLQPGLYFLKVTKDGKSAIKKIIKQ
ncbi:MAG: T9SS type A sorting domain-containing protein [Paludibacteraceae bacterium]|nr:T9SS type A sorting domain-containing protein [Paludibacteraceae bacterium]